MNRRTFLQTSVAASFFAAHPSWAAAGAGGLGAAGSPHHIDRIGLQLYTVRDLLRQDFDGTLAKVAQVGYKEVEFAGYFDHTPQQVRAALDKNGLSSPSAHLPYETIENKLPEALDTAHTIGQSFIVCPWIDTGQRNPDGWKRATALFNRAGETCQKAGIQFAYHNHAFEFEPAEGLGGKVPYEFLLAETDPKLVKMEMDLCWMTVAGADPAKYFGQYPGRFPLVHVKDWKEDSSAAKDYDGAVGPHSRKGQIMDVGQGEVPFKRIFAQSQKAGIQHYIVENDEPKSPYDDLRTCYQYLAKLTF